jgi:hypothetical protein
MYYANNPCKISIPAFITFSNVKYRNTVADFGLIHARPIVEGNLDQEKLGEKMPMHSIKYTGQNILD